MRKNLITFGALTAITLGTVLGCGASAEDRNGDPGKVVGRDEDHWTTKAGKTRTSHSDYDLTIRRADGSTYDKDVSSEAYDHCYRGSKYPACVDN